MLGVGCHLPHCLADLLDCRTRCTLSLARRGRLIRWVDCLYGITDSVDIPEYSRAVSQMLPEHISPYQLQTDAALSGTIYVPRSTNYFTRCTQTAELIALLYNYMYLKWFASTARSAVINLISSITLPVALY